MLEYVVDCDQVVLLLGWNIEKKASFDIGNAKLFAGEACIIFVRFNAVDYYSFLK